MEQLRNFEISYSQNRESSVLIVVKGYYRRDARIRFWEHIAECQSLTKEGEENIYTAEILSITEIIEEEEKKGGNNLREIKLCSGDIENLISGKFIDFWVNDTHSGEIKIRLQIKKGTTIIAKICC
jgi:hypothetical protein